MTKKIWLQAKRFDLIEVDEDPQVMLKDVTLEENGSSADLIVALKATFIIPTDNSVVIKLRNHRGSLIPANGRIATNSKTVPYQVEVWQVHQNFKPQKIASENPTNIETLKKTTEDLLKRLGALEATLPALSEKRTLKIHKELENMEQKLLFLNKRINQADTTKWEGMFKRNPLW